MDAPDGLHLISTFCDPDLQQAFSLTADHRLIYERTGRCVTHPSPGVLNAPLTLTDCSSAAGFVYQSNGSLILTQGQVGGDQLCVTPMTSSHEVNPSPCLGDPVGVTRCDWTASTNVLLEENFFLEDRKLMLNLNFTDPTPECDFKLCALNKPTPPIKLLPADQVTRCNQAPWDCLTIITKTARRPHLVLRMAKSIPDSYGYDLPLIAFDDGPDDYPPEIRSQLAQHPRLQYVVGEDEDYGIAEGRNRALAMVRTKYFMLIDDDVEFLPSTRVDIMLDMLDTTDATMVGGQLLGRGNIAGLMRVGYFGGTKRRIGMFGRACVTSKYKIENFPECYQCDSNTNVFMGRTREIQDIGGWDPELKVLEHKDIFIRMKAAGLKIGVCPKILLRHDKPRVESPNQVEGYVEKRWRNFHRFHIIMNTRWTVQNVFAGHWTKDENGESVLDLEVKEKGHC